MKIYTQPHENLKKLRQEDLSDEELLTCLIEECCELAHSLSKCKRFGPKSVNPYDEHKVTNLESANEEYAQIVYLFMEYFERHGPEGVFLSDFFEPANHKKIWVLR